MIDDPDCKTENLHPRIDADGTHVLPIRSVFSRDDQEIQIISGEVRWDARKGVTFIIEFSESSSQWIENLRETQPDRSCVGEISTPSRQLDWKASLFNSGVLSAFGTLSSVAKTQRRTLTESTTSYTLKGQVLYLYAELPLDNEFAFDQLDEHESRLFMVGFDCLHWPNTIQIERSLPFGASSSIGRGEIRLADALALTMFSAEATHRIDGGVFLSTNDTFPGLEAALRSHSGDENQDVLAFLFGAPARGLWREWNHNRRAGFVHRLYFGWKTEECTYDRQACTQPLPLAGISEAFEHHEKVLAQLPQIFTSSKGLPKEIRIPHYLQPIWLAYQGFWEDRLVLASIAIERFAQSMTNAGLLPQQTGEPSIDKATYRKLLKRFRKSVKDESVGLTAGEQTFVNRKIENLNQPTNSDRLERCFECLGVSLSDRDRIAIGRRNKMLHGHAAIEPDASLDDKNQFAEEFDILRMLLHKATLRLLHYEGPYIDYSVRGTPPGERVKMMPELAETTERV